MLPSTPQALLESMGANGSTGPEAVFAAEKNASMLTARAGARDPSVIPSICRVSAALIPCRICGLTTMKPTKGKGAAKRETLKPVDDRKVGKRKAVGKADKSSKGKAKKGKLAKDPNKPKRPPSAFFVFLEEFRKTFKKENPDVKAVSAVGKAGGEKWKSMSAAEKAPYEAKATKRKGDYQKLMTAYNKKQESTADDADEESDKSKSEINDEDEEDSGQEDEEEEDDEDED